jgi:predicted O-methyltransferase YrrM
MSYVGYLPLIKHELHGLPKDRSVSVLEVGIDRGTTLIPLVAFLARTRAGFVVLGVDVLVQEQVRLILNNLDLQAGQEVACIQGNSLQALPELVKTGMKFDVIMLDGDHNYHTVSNELSSLEDLCHPHTLVVIDDYDGRWSERDLWYSEREGYQDVTSVTKPVDTEKHGVKPAVDDWLVSHPGWELIKPIQGEPIILRKK